MLLNFVVMLFFLKQEITTDSGRKLLLTKDHLIYTTSDVSSDKKVAVFANNVHVGSYIFMEGHQSVMLKGKIVAK